MSVVAKNHLPDAAYAFAPGSWKGTMTTQELRETLLATNGWILGSGIQRDICSRELGAGVHQVWVEARR